MNYMPGEFVRRAAANVTSTVSSTVSGAVSSVTQAAGGKKRHDSVIGDNMLHHGKDKYNLLLKVRNSSICIMCRQFDGLLYLLRPEHTQQGCRNYCQSRH
jgi:hypothetical protein